MHQNPPSAHIRAANRAMLEALPFEDTQDFEDARRGFIAALEPAIVRSASGGTVWDGESYAFLRATPRTRSTRACGGSRSLSTLRVCSRSSKASTRCGDSTSPTSRSSRATAASSSSIRSSPPRRPPPRSASIANTAGTGRSSPSSTRTATPTTSVASSASPPRPTWMRAVCRSSRPRVSSRTPSRRTSSPAPPWVAAPGTCTAQRLSAARSGRWGPASARRRRPGRSDSSCRPSTSARRARRTSWTASRSSSRWRPGPRRPPRCTSTPRSSGRCAWPRMRATRCTTSSRSAARSCATRTAGRDTSPRRSHATDASPT